MGFKRRLLQRIRLPKDIESNIFRRHFEEYLCESAVVFFY